MGENVNLELAKAIIKAKPELLKPGKEAESAWRILEEVRASEPKAKNQ
jgi:hypothetical protein